MIFSLLSINVLAQEVMTLEKAIIIGLEENFQIKIDEANVRIAENNNSWARAGRGPTVDLNGSLTLNFVDDNNPASFLNAPFFTGSLGGSLDANWLVLSGGRVAIQKDQLDLAIRQQQQLQGLNAHNVIREIIRNYNNVLLQQERLDVLRQLINLSRDRLAYEEVRKEFGSSNSFNLIQFEDAIYADSANVIAQINQIDIAKRNVNSILSISTDTEFSYPEKLNVQLEDLDLEKLKDMFLENSPTLKSLQIIGELNALNEQLEQAAKKPTVNINGTVGLSETYFKILQSENLAGFPTKGNFSNQFNAGVGANLNWNLYNGGVINADIENAKIQKEINELDILQTTLEISNQLDILVANYNSQKELLTLTGDQLSLAKRNLDMSEERFKLGQITSLDYRTIQVQYLNVAFARVNAMFTVISTKTEIDWLVGLFNG